MRSFRFPFWMISLMVTVLVTVFVAIEKARTLSFQLSTGSSDVPGNWWTMPGVLAAFLVVTGVFGVLGRGMLRGLRRD